MALVVPDVGEGEMLKRILNMTVTDNDVVVRLFSNDYTPIEGSVVGSFTELTGSGDGAPAAITATPGSWSITEDDPSDATHTQMSFIFSAGATKYCYGYYMTNTAGTILLWAERFSDSPPYTVPSAGGTIYITPKIELA